VPNQKSPLEPGARIVKGGFVVLATYLIMMFLNVISTIAMLRLLGDEGYGTYGVGISLFSIIQGIAVLGIPTAAVRYIAKFMAKGDIASTKIVLRTSVKYLIISSAGFSIALALLAGPIASGIYHNVNYTNTFRVVAVMIPPGILLLGFIAFLQGFQRMKYYSYVQISWSSLRLFISIGLVLLGFFATGALLGYGIGIAAACALGILLLFRIVPKKRGGGCGKADIPHEMRSTAVQMWLASVGGLILVWCPNLLIGSILSMKSAGYYFASLSFITIISFFSGAISTPLFPAVSELWALGDKRGLERMVGISLKLTFAVIFPIATVTAVFSRFILALMGGSAFIAGATVLSILSVALIFQILEGINDVILCGIGKPRVFAKIYWAGVLSTVMITIPAAFLYGINGVAAGYLITIVLITFLGTYSVKKLAKLKYSQPAFFKIVLADVVMIALLLCFRPFVTTTLHAIFVGMIGILTYMAILLLSGFISRSDVQMLQQISKDMGEPSVLVKITNFLKRFARQT